MTVLLLLLDDTRSIIMLPFSDEKTFATITATEMPSPPPKTKFARLLTVLLRKNKSTIPLTPKAASELRLLRKYAKAPGRTPSERILKKRLARYNEWRTSAGMWSIMDASNIRALRTKSDAYWTEVLRTAKQYFALKAASPREKKRLRLKYGQIKRLSSVRQ